MFMIRMNSDEHKEAVRRRDKLDPRMYLAEYARRAMLGLLPRDSEDDDERTT